MKEIRFDFNNMLDINVGNAHGVGKDDILEMAKDISSGHDHLRGLAQDSRNRVNLGLEWMVLPYQKSKVVLTIKKLGDEIARKYYNVIFLGIGGSYLGLKAAQDALAVPYYNEFAKSRNNRPRVYFEGNNLDPDTISVLLKNLNPKKTFVVVISKSGETTETKAAFISVEGWLKKGVGKNYGRQIFVITDPDAGSLRKRVTQENARDSLSFRSLPLLKGVGGRYSEFNMGLLHLAIIGVDINEVFKGAKDMDKKCSISDYAKNPAYMYALLHTILYKKKSKPLAIMMPFAEGLKSTADWYVQLLAESLGKKFRRKINVSYNGVEEWARDKGTAVNVGRTPIPCRGTGDLHSVQQNNIEGQNDKVVTFIRVDKFKNEMKITVKGDILSGKGFTELIKLAQEATEWALVRESRPNCTIILPEVSAYYWGALLFFFQMATAFEGELLNVNAYDQPGVEGYKNYMYTKLGKPGISREIAEEINNNPLKKDQNYII
ncbi:MAG: Glucose-6-phosphate isomerase [Candidatus Omnitrophica bacterium ADurb.Bin205]|nr:MAG: Glucose-6-phosphate isomerase [Candidatus Omnitrophica bacterium ADurb.Bin205]